MINGFFLFRLLFLKYFFKKYPAVLKHEFQQVVDFLCQIYTNQADEKVVKGTCRLVGPFHVKCFMYFNFLIHF